MTSPQNVAPLEKRAERLSGSGLARPRCSASITSPRSRATRRGTSTSTSGCFGLRFVKRTVNFDDPQTYHFYFGNEVGTPGSILTFFPWPGARRGRHGTGQVAVTSFAAVPSAVGFWTERLVRHGIAFKGPTTRSGGGSGPEKVITFEDPDGLMLEIVAHASAEARPTWGGAAGIPVEHALHGFHAVTLWEEVAGETERLLVDIMGFRGVSDDATTRRYAAGNGGAGMPH